MYSQHYLEIIVVIILNIGILPSHMIHALGSPLCFNGSTNISWIEFSPSSRGSYQSYLHRLCNNMIYGVLMLELQVSLLNTKNNRETKRGKNPPLLLLTETCTGHVNQEGTKQASVASQLACGFGECLLWREESFIPLGLLSEQQPRNYCHSQRYY